MMLSRFSSSSIRNIHSLFSFAAFGLDEEKSYPISSPINGTVTKINVKPEDKVEAGDIVVMIES